MFSRYKFFLVSYRRLPGVEFIYLCDTETWVKVSTLFKNQIDQLRPGITYGIIGELIFLFENISSEDANMFATAIRWYKTRKRLNNMSVWQLSKGG